MASHPGEAATQTTKAAKDNDDWSDHKTQFLTVRTEQFAPQTTSYAVAHGRSALVSTWAEQCSPKTIASVFKASADCTTFSLGTPHSRTNSGLTASLRPG